MASLTPSILPKDPHTQIIIVGATLVLLIGVVFAITLSSTKKEDEEEEKEFEDRVHSFSSMIDDRQAIDVLVSNTTYTDK